MKATSLIESMFSIMNECANIYETENGEIVVTYEYYTDNETMKRYFNNYDEAIEYLYKNGYTW